MLESDEFFVAPLPPKPDPHTGNPRPPRAPVDHASGDGSSQLKNTNKPNPPPGQSPTLEWYRESPRSAVFSGMGGFVVVAAGSGVLLDPYYWYSASSWWLWLFPLAAGVLITLTMGPDSCCAGADWVTHGKEWINTYELTSVRIVHAESRRKLTLADRRGQVVNLPLPTVQGNQNLWDLVYNGILHSINERDVDINPLARYGLKLPQPPLT